MTRFQYSYQGYPEDEINMLYPLLILENGPFLSFKKDFAGYNPGSNSLSSDNPVNVTLMQYMAVPG
jgi:hypothetical protein